MAARSRAVLGPARAQRAFCHAGLSILFSQALLPTRLDPPNLPPLTSKFPNTKRPKSLILGRWRGTKGPAPPILLNGARPPTLL